jgi:ApaG protein
MYTAVTDRIEVSVEPFYMADRSDPEQGRYVWAYRVTIDNQSDQPVKLLSRYWHITDGNGKVEEVRGPGVVGEQPELQPGDSYQYTSGCPLPTPSGIMTGRYKMRGGRGQTFDIAIPAFSLDLPDQRRTVN